MTSKTSCFDSAIWKRSLRKTLPLWICYLLCWLLLMPGTFLNFNYGYEHYRALSGELCEQVLGFCTIGSCVAAVIGVLAAWVLFSWLFRANAAYFYAGLPVRREALFVTNTLLGLVMVTLIHLITALASYLVLLLHGYPQLYACLCFFGASTLSFLCFFGFALLLVVIIGQAAVMPAVYVILNFASVALFSATNSLLSDFVYGMEYASWWETRFSSVFYKLSPVFLFMMQGLPTSAVFLPDGSVDPAHYRFDGWGYVGALAIAGLVFAVIALLLFRRREMERSGDAIAVKSLRPVFLYCFTAGCAVIFAYILTAFQSTTPVGARAFRQTLLFLLLGAAIGYFLAQMLLKKSIAVFRGAKTWVGLGAVCLVLALGCTAARYDVLGLYARVPDASDVSYIDNSYLGQMTDPADIEAFTQLQKLIIERRQENEQNAQYDWTSVYFTYHLKDGTVRSFRYRLAAGDLEKADPDSLVCRYDAITNSASMVLSRCAIPEEFTPDKSAFVYCGIEDYSADLPKDASAPRYLSADEAYEFYTTCILPDLEDTELGKIHITAFSDDRQYANSLLATVTFHIDPTDEQLTAYQTRWAETHESEPSREYASSTISTDFTYSITADASRSIAYLQALGYTLDRPLG